MFLFHFRNNAMRKQACPLLCDVSLLSLPLLLWFISSIASYHRPPSCLLIVHMRPTMQATVSGLKRGLGYGLGAILGGVLYLSLGANTLFQSLCRSSFIVCSSWPLVLGQTSAGGGGGDKMRREQRRGWRDGGRGVRQESTNVSTHPCVG